MFLQERQKQLFLTMVQIEKEKLIKANHLLTSVLCLINYSFYFYVLTWALRVHYRHYFKQNKLFIIMIVFV